MAYRGFDTAATPPTVPVRLLGLSGDRQAWPFKALTLVQSSKNPLSTCPNSR
jgi:hypothetical protein